MAVQFTRNGRRAMVWAQVEAMRRGDGYVECEHLLLGLLHGDETGAHRVLGQLGIDPAPVREAAQSHLSPESGGTRVENSQLSQTAKKVVAQARRETEDTGDDYVGTAHLLLALLRGSEAGIDTSEGPFADMTRLGLTYDRAAQVVREGAGHHDTEDDNGPRLTLSDLRAANAPAPRPAAAPVAPGFLRGRSLLSVNDLSTDEIRALFALTREVKIGRPMDSVARNKTLALLFEKPSLRTRVTFAVAMTRLGGQHINLQPSEIGMGTREPVADVARLLGRTVDAIAARTFADATVRQLASNAGIPVVNALTDLEHPCQALADFYTILEHRTATEGQKLVFVGDGNNVAHSLMLLAPRLGTHFTLACPPGYEPDPALVAQTHDLARAHGTRFEVVHDALQAADDADILYTDVWASMGQEAESTKRASDFAAFQLNADLVREAKDDVLVLHCLPAHRGEEISAEVMDGPHAQVWDQAENRLHVQQALLAAIL